jgi:hypothetical protein
MMLSKSPRNGPGAPWRFLLVQNPLSAGWSAVPGRQTAGSRMAHQVVRSTNIVGLILLAYVGAIFCPCFWFSAGHGASLSALDRIRPGMTRENVVDLLCRPGTINRFGNGAESWFYKRWTFCQVKVYMTPERVVEETDHDH